MAGGIGITPFVPIVRDLIENAPHTREVTLVHGTNKPSELLYADEFKALAECSSKFSYIQVVAFDDQWQGQKGFVTDTMRELDLKGYSVYMCGPKPMTTAATAMLADAGISEADIFLETA